MNIVESFLAGSTRALARLLTMVENEHPDIPAIFEQIYPHAGNALFIGITGFPGSGKSTLIDQMVRYLRSLNKRIGVLAVDPSSSFTGGAILGDRVRMNEIAGDVEVFMRSFGTRGSLGGLSQAVGNCAALLDAFGKDVILIETVGVGQSEIDIADIADTTLVVCVPGMGDDIQAIKSGIMEIGDLLVINKADMPGAEKTEFFLEMMIDLQAPGGDGWKPRILKTIATTGDGIPELWAAIRQHQAHLAKTGKLSGKRREKIEAQVTRIIQRKIFERVMNQVKRLELWDMWIEKVCRHEASPLAAAERLLTAVTPENRSTKNDNSS